jgi:hypothetical protein
MEDRNKLQLPWLIWYLLQGFFEGSFKLQGDKDSLIQLCTIPKWNLNLWPTLKKRGRTSLVLLPINEDISLEL